MHAPSERAIAPYAEPGQGVVLAGRYRLDERIARGGMGVVHRAWDLRLDRAVAVKILHPHLAADDAVERRFRAEARYAARVKHPNVVALLDQDEHHGTPFIVMELIRGHTLRELFQAKQRLTPHEVLEFLAPACAGLTAIHRSGLVHRDVKPENLLIDETGTLRVTDFGISRALDASQHTPAGMLLGSVRYMAPEVLMGHPATPASDQYALGVVLFEALTGRPPHPADDPAAAAVHRLREAIPAPSSAVPDVTTDLDYVVTTATARRPGDRYPDVAALAAAARAAVGDRRASAPPGPAPTPARGPATAARQTPARDPRTAAATPAQTPARDLQTPEPSPPGWQRHGRFSVLAIVALALVVLADGGGGIVVAGLCGTLAGRRILRRNLRGMWVAYLTIGVAALRLLQILAQRPA